MQILHVIGSANFGGIEKLVLMLAQYQLKAGNVTPSVLFANMSGEFLHNYKATGMQLYSANCRSGYGVSIEKYKTVRKIYRQFDVIHFHFFNPFLAWCAVHEGRPVIYTEHGNFGFGRKATIQDWVKNLLKKKYLNTHVQYISFNSEFTKMFADNRYGLSGKNRSVIYNGLDIEDISGNMDCVDTDIKKRIEHKFVVGTCSRFAGFKRIDRLISAFSIFQEGKNDVMLLLVGDGVLYSELQAMVKNTGIEEKVIFAGYRDNAHDYQCAMDISVYSSESEPFGLVAIESLALGKPVLVFQDGGGLKEIVGGYSGDDVVESIEDLSSRMAYYYRYQDEMLMKRDERKKYAERFNVQTMGEAFLDVYKEVSECAA